jgi:hypothetical protein
VLVHLSDLHVDDGPHAPTLRGGHLSVGRYRKDLKSKAYVSRTELDAKDGMAETANAVNLKLDGARS